MDSTIVEVLFLVCNRAAVSESLASVPPDELPDYEFFQGYAAPPNREIDLAWSDVFPQITAWLAERNRKRKEQARAQSEPDNGNMWAFRR